MVQGIGIIKFRGVRSSISSGLWYEIVVWSIHN
jgi:hypothetical protein